MTAIATSIAWIVASCFLRGNECNQRNNSRFIANLESLNAYNRKDYLMTTIKRFLVAAYICVGIHTYATAQQALSGIVYASPENGIVILETSHARSPYIAITNYSGSDATLGRHVHVTAKQVGIYHYDDSPLELWDATPPERDLGKIALINKTNSANGRVYIQNARTILAGLQTQQAEVQNKITKLQAGGVITNAAGTNSLITLQRQQQTLSAKIQSQQQAVQNLTDFYHLE